MEAIPGIGARIYSLIVKKSPLSKKWFNEFAEEISSKISTGIALDIGTGPGILPMEIAHRAPGLEIVGIDLSAAMINIANKSKETKAFDGRVRFQHANAENLPFPDNYFDFVMSTLSMHHWAKPNLCLAEIGRVLKKNSEAWIYDLRRDTSETVNTEFKKNYGRFPAFVVLNIVRLHSSLTLQHAEQILASVGGIFSQKRIEEKGIFLKIVLTRGSSL